MNVIGDDSYGFNSLTLH